MLFLKVVEMIVVLTVNRIGLNNLSGSIPEPRSLCSNNILMLEYNFCIIMYEKIQRGKKGSKKERDFDI